MDTSTSDGALKTDRLAKSIAEMNLDERAQLLIDVQKENDEMQEDIIREFVGEEDPEKLYASIVKMMMDSYKRGEMTKNEFRLSMVLVGHMIQQADRQKKLISEENEL
jgi:hypothetical protein